MLKLMYITNDCAIAKIAEQAGVDRIFIDMEELGKSDRQGGMNTVQCHHSIKDIEAVRKVIKKSEILVRCNPIHDKVCGYCSSQEEIDGIISAGADIIMLPYFKTANEVRKFISIVDGRAKTMLLFETPSSFDNADEILDIDGIDEVYIGLNDMSLGYGKRFMFELLVDGTVQTLVSKFKNKRYPFGFGGIASLGKGLLNSKFVIGEHYRLGSGSVILSRSFLDSAKSCNLDELKTIFAEKVRLLREYETTIINGDVDFNENRVNLEKSIKEIVKSLG